jgi:hypothetical protein
VIIAGNYNGVLAFGTFPSVMDNATPPGPDATRAILFVAKLDKDTGTVLASQTWGTAGRNDAYSITTDRFDNVVLGGVIGGNVDFGGGFALVDLGATDAFAAKLNSSLATVWAKSFGDANYDQTVNSVATGYDGRVYLAGSFTGTLGGLGLSSASNTAVDAWTARLDAADGTPSCMAKYGDALGAQSVSVISVARAGDDSIFIGGSFTNYMDFAGSPALTPLYSGGAGIAASYVTVMTP